MSILKWICDEVATGDPLLEGLATPLSEDELTDSSRLDRRAKHGRKLLVSMTMAFIGPRKMVPQHTVSLCQTIKGKREIKFRFCALT